MKNICLIIIYIYEFKISLFTIREKVFPKQKNYQVDVFPFILHIHLYDLI